MLRPKVALDPRFWDIAWNTLLNDITYTCKDADYLLYENTALEPGENYIAGCRVPQDAKTSVTIKIYMYSYHNPEEEASISLQYLLGRKNIWVFTRDA